MAQCVDSSRFFAIRVVGGGGRKATLGIGFEERPDAFDFGISLQDAGKVLGFEEKTLGQQGRGGSQKGPVKQEVKRDYSLKEGETITVNLPSRAGRARDTQGETRQGGGEGVLPLLPPPPSAADVRKDMDDAFGGSAAPLKTPTAEELGFDDGEFGEFQ